MLKLNPVRFGLIVFIFSILPILGLAAPQDRPAFTTDEQRVAYLTYLLSELPELATQAAAHSADMIQILAQEDALIQRINGTPAVQALYAAKPDLQEISFEPTKQVVGKYRSVDADTLAKWKTQIAEIAAAEKTTSSDAIDQQLRDALSKVDSINPSGIFTGLIQAIPANARANLLTGAQAPNEIISRLERVLTEDLFRAHFKADRFKELGATTGLRDALTLLRTGLELEAKAVSLFRYRASTLDTHKKDLDFFGDEAMIERLTTLFPSRSSTRLLSQAAKQGITLQEGTHPVSQGRWTVREVAPYLGTFRGFLGGDCSTSSAFGYARAANEHTYFIYDPEGQVIGYTMATAMNINGARYLYIHDLTGATLSTETTHQLIQAFRKLREQLGFSEILMADNNMIQSANHFEPPKVAQRFYKQNQADAVTLVYDQNDWTSRGFIAQNTQASAYDLPSQNPIRAGGYNTTGHIVRDVEQYSSQIEVQLKTLPGELPDFTKAKISRIRLLTLVMALVQQPQGAAAANLLLRNMDIDPTISAQLTNFITRPGNYTLMTGLGVLQEIARSLGYKSLKEFSKENEAMAAKVALGATDAVFSSGSGEAHELVINSLALALKTPETYHNHLNNFFNTYRSQLQTSPFHRRILEQTMLNPKITSRLGRLLTHINPTRANYGFSYIANTDLMRFFTGDVLSSLAEVYRTQPGNAQRAAILRAILLSQAESGEIYLDWNSPSHAELNFLSNDVTALQAICAAKKTPKLSVDRYLGIISAAARSGYNTHAVPATLIALKQGWDMPAGSLRLDPIRNIQDFKNYMVAADTPDFMKTELKRFIMASELRGKISEVWRQGYDAFKGDAAPAKELLGHIVKVLEGNPDTFSSKRLSDFEPAERKMLALLLKRAVRTHETKELATKTKSLLRESVSRHRNH